MDIDSFTLCADCESFQGREVVHADILEIRFFIFVFGYEKSSTRDCLVESWGENLDSKCGLDFVVLDIG